MFKRGGFASYTKTGRGIAIGRALGEGLARGGSKSSTSQENKDEPSFCVGVMIIILIIYILHTITQVTKPNQVLK
jgi:hypothetical protein